MIPRLHVSLTAPGMTSLYLAQWALTLLTVGCLTGSACIWWYGQELEEQTDHLQRNISELGQLNQQMMVKASSQGFDLTDSRIQKLPQEVAFAKRIWKQQAFSWTQFLNDLEAAVPSNVSMDSVTLNFKDATIALNGSTATLDDLNRLVDRLENHKAFHDVELSQHSLKTKKKDKKTKLVKFTMTVLYRPIET